MKTALLLLDVQKGIVDKGNLYSQVEIIKSLTEECKKMNIPIIATKHIDLTPGSIIEYGTNNSEILDLVIQDAKYIIEKSKANAFFNTNLSEILKKLGIEQLIIAGFNAEYCCLFTTIAANDRGYKVIYIEDATGTSNNGDTYEMKNIDIVDFIGCIFDWSDMIEVLYYDEYIERRNHILG